MASPVAGEWWRWLRLGLVAIVRDIALAHQVRIKVENGSEGVGAHITISLPGVL